MKKKFKYIFGPVHSWRLGVSLGIDPISRNSKVCNFNCAYCQLGETEHFCNERKVYVPIQSIVNEIKAFPRMKIDYLTFSGRGEPTLAKNLGGMIKAIKEFRKEKIAVITNGALISREDVQKDLSLADFVLIKFDACSQETLSTINRAVRDVSFVQIVKGMKKFREKFNGKLGLQIMFISANKNYTEEIVKIAEEIGPDEVQINTPLRPSQISPLDKKDIEKIKECFHGFCVKTVYDSEHVSIDPMDREATMKRHGKF